MRRYRLLLVVVLIGISSTLRAHDLFLKLADFRVRPNAAVRIAVLNGTFTVSQNSIARARVADLSLVGPAGRVRLDTTQFHPVGPRTSITARTGAAGTYLLGLSTNPNQLTLKGAEFNAYLREEGLGDVLEARRRDGELGKSVSERYAKHVKAIFQAGAVPSEDYGVPLGYPAELMPLRNPYELKPGDTLRVRLLVNGARAVGVETLAGGRNTRGIAFRTQRLRSDTAGVVPIVLTAAGTWYVKFISMTRSSEPGLDYISQWATLTFAVFPATRKAEP